MSKLVNVEAIDSGDDLFDMDVDLSTPTVHGPEEESPVDEPDEPDVREEAKHNAFAAIEDRLGLPFGSTKEGIKAAKETTKQVVQSVKDLKSQYSVIESKEEINKALPVPRYDMDTLAADRARLRDLAFKDLEIANNWLKELDEQIKGTIAPTDQNWAAAANMYKTVSKGITDITRMLVTLRQEDELMKLQLSGGKSGDDNGEVDESDPLSKSKGRPMTPQETIALVREWSKERDKEIEQQIEEEAAARQKNLATIDEIDANQA